MILLLKHGINIQRVPSLCAAACSKAVLIGRTWIYRILTKKTDGAYCVLKTNALLCTSFNGDLLHTLVSTLVQHVFKQTFHPGLGEILKMAPVTFCSEALQVFLMVQMQSLQ